MSPYIFSPSLFLFHRPFFPPPLSPLPTPRPSVVEKRARYLWLARYNFARAFCARSVEENRQLSLRSPPPYIHLLSHSLSLYSFLPFSSVCTYIYIYILYDLFYFLCLRFYRIPFVNANPVNMVSRKFLFLSFFPSFLRRRKSHWIKFRKIETTEWNIGKRIEGGSESECAMDFGGKMAG